MPRGYARKLLPRGRGRKSAIVNVSRSTLDGMGVGDSTDLSGFDLRDLLDTSLGQSITDALKSSATSVAKQVGKSYDADLSRFGRKIARSSVAQLIEPLPEAARNYIQPGYTEPKPLPTWVAGIVNPIMDPITAGAKQEAYETSRRIVPIAAGAIFLILLTGFVFGYTLKSLTTSENS